MDEVGIFRKLAKTKENLKDLSREEAYLFLKAILEREISKIKSSAFFTAMRIKGETAEELFGFYEALQEKMLIKDSNSVDCLDVATNYDGKVRSPYILPSAIFIAIANGIKITFHGEDCIPVKEGETGKLLLRGPNVFSGYLNHDGKSPFVEYQGKQWYDSGDLIVEHDGILTFAGRLKRFIKLGGEMISLPAIEEILTCKFPGEEEPLLAVSATPGDDHPEILLFLTFDLEREEANKLIREFGFSALHSIRRTIRVETIPVLGTGKIDYRALEVLGLEQDQKYTERGKI